MLPMKLPRMFGLILCLWGVATASAASSNIVINELMYHPSQERDDLQYVEVYNRGTNVVDLSGWAFTMGVAFTFPENTKLAPDSYLVVTRNLTEFKNFYGRSIPALGNFTGHLSHKGDRVELSGPDRKLVDWVKYSDTLGWPKGPDGYSASLERISPLVDDNGPANWAGSKLPAMSRPSGTPGKRNDSFSANLPPAITNVKLTPPQAKPGEKVAVEVTIADADGVKDVKLLHRNVVPGRQGQEVSLAMNRISGDSRQGVYQAVIAGQPGGTLSRVRVTAIDEKGMTRIHPSPNEPAPALSYYTFDNTNSAKIAFGFVHSSGKPQERGNPGRFGRPASENDRNEPPTGQDAFIYVPPNGQPVQVFDYVRVTSRKGGFKVRFLKDNKFKEMSTANIIFEGSPRWILSEPLAYELYRLAGVPAEMTEHIRINYDGQWRGLQLLIEQPNRSFLARHHRDTSGNLYKLLWYENGLVGQHEKKTNLRNGHTDLVNLVNELNKTRGEEQWRVIEKNFNVPEMINYYAVNLCIQNWDGFFNNYFIYHDVGKTGKWEIYPWDEDKTWGDYDGASQKYDWYTMPLTFGMNGDKPVNESVFGNRGGFGGGSWWRPGGWFSGPLLANPTFRQKFLLRLREICQTSFTEERFLPVINSMETRLDGEPGLDTRQFKANMQSFRNQVANRRQFILKELDRK